MTKKPEPDPEVEVVEEIPVEPVPEGSLTLSHPDIQDSFVATQAAYEELWKDKGWVPEDSSSESTETDAAAAEDSD